MCLYIDFETKSEADLEEVGLHNYATHKSTSVLMLAWAVGDEEPNIWEPPSDMPERLRSMLLDPKVDIVAYNSSFERYILKYVLGIEIPISRFQDPQASARYLSLPASLEDVGIVLNLPAELQKNKRGEALIELFSYPKKKKKSDAVFFYDKTTHPNEWEEFKNYDKQNIRAEREIARRESLLGAYPLPKKEREVWILDQKINDRGIPLDLNFVSNAFSIAEKDKQKKIEEQNRLTGLENANSPIQLLKWVQNLGYPLNNLRKSNIEIILKNKQERAPNLQPLAEKVLQARMEAGSTTYKKLQSMIRNVSSDGVLRNQFVYMGSSRCGRWSGNSVQLQNLARPDSVFENIDNVNKARKYIYDNDYESLLKEFPSHTPLLVIKNLIRTVFSAPDGYRFNVCDLNAIETRVAAWVSQCSPLLKVFEDKRDPYIDFASKIFNVTYDSIWHDLKILPKTPEGQTSDGKARTAKAKQMRQIAKPGVLGAVYRLSGGDWGEDKNGDVIKMGLWGYAENMGVDMTKEQAQQVVKVFREAYKEIGGQPDLNIGFSGGIWYLLENAVRDVLKGSRTVRKLGPDDCIVIDKLTIKNRNPILRIKLPSGRYLHYFDSSLQEVKMPWKKKKEIAVEFDESGEGTKFEIKDVDVYKLGITYSGKNQQTGQWDLIISHGGKIFENIVQAIARDVLAEKLLELDAKGLNIIGHVHDEGISLTSADPFSPGAAEMEKIMSRPVSWALSLPLGAEGFEDTFYHK